MTHPIITRNYEIWSNLEFRYKVLKISSSKWNQMIKN